jgi:hypothetical protein
VQFKRLGEDARGRGLAGAARTDKQVGVGDATAGDRVLQGAHHVVLTHDVVKRLGTPFAGNDLVRGRHRLHSKQPPPLRNRKLRRLRRGRQRTATDGRLQMSRAYSRMVRSLENLPTRAVFRMACLAHAFELR